MLGGNDPQTQADEKLTVPECESAQVFKQQPTKGRGTTATPRKISILLVIGLVTTVGDMIDRTGNIIRELKRINAQPVVVRAFAGEDGRQLPPGQPRLHQILPDQQPQPKPKPKSVIKKR
jgi:hypothetical protein